MLWIIFCLACHVSNTPHPHPPHPHVNQGCHFDMLCECVKCTWWLKGMLGHMGTHPKINKTLNETSYVISRLFFRKWIQHAVILDPFLCPTTRKWRGIMLYPPKFWVSVRPSVCLSVCPSVRPCVRPSVSAHHHSCIGNSSYSFRPILLKLYRCFKDGLKICTYGFFRILKLFFITFFPFLT